MNKTLLLVLVILGAGTAAIWGFQQAETGENGATGTTTQEATFAESIDYTITGIEPGAGIMSNTETAIEAYELDTAGWSLQESSAAAMLSAIRDAVEAQEPILATVWEPHAVFAVADMRKLDDPQNIYNNPASTTAFLEEHAPAWADAEVASDVIASVVYQGFAEDAPAAAAFLENFQVPADTQSQWIFALNIEEREASAIAEEYLANQQALTEEWLPAEDVARGKETISIGIPPWPGATVKSEVVRQLLQEMGYTVEVSELDIGVLYTALANEEIDVNLAGWLPSTHASYWEEHGETLEIAGVNVTTTWLGLGVPAYVDEDIRSIEDLTQQ